MAEGGSIRTDRLMYCHSCANSFRRSEEMVLECPRCDQHFVEEVDDVQRFTEEAGVLIPNFSNATGIGPMNYNSDTASSIQALRSSLARQLIELDNVNRASRRLARLESISANVSHLLQRPRAIREPQLPPAMTQAQLDGIPKATITKEQEDLDIKCAVCFDPFKMNEDEIRKLPCNHLFHDKCIFPWLQTNPSCPVCRAPLPNQRNGLFDRAALNTNFPVSISDWLRRMFGYIATDVNQQPPTSVTANAQISFPSTRSNENIANRTRNSQTQTTVRVAERATDLSILVSTTSRQVAEEENGTAHAYNESITTCTRRQETREATRRVPRRAAALRARRAIIELYRPRHGRNDQTSDTEN